MELSPLGTGGHAEAFWWEVPSSMVVESEQARRGHPCNPERRNFCIAPLPWCGLIA